MNSSRRMLFAVSLFALCISAPLSVLADDDTNPLKDPNFEAGLPPDKGGWILFGASEFTKDQARRGRRSMFNGGFFSVSGSVQEVPAGPGQRWRLTGYGLASDTLLGAPAFGIVQVTYFDENGVELGTVETEGQPFPAKASNEVNGQSPTNEWIFLDTGIATAPTGAASIQAFTLYVDFSGSDFQGVYFDNLSLCLLESDDDDDDDDEVECQEFDDDDGD